MRRILAAASARRLMAGLLAALFMLGIGPLALTQDDGEAENSAGVDPVKLGLEIAREIVEEEREAPLTLIRWRYYEDNWSNEASLQAYGAYGIDNCVDAVPLLEKRADVLFGWTFSLLDASGKEYQARVSYDLMETAICDEVRVPPAYGGGTTSQAEAAAVAPPPSAGPGGFHLGGHVASLDSAAVGAMKRAGMTWVKKQVKFGQTDGGGVISAARAQGFKVLLGALGDKNALAADFNGYSDKFAEYLAHLARQGAHAIEVWNEPNIEREWPRGQISGAKYTELLKKAYAAIKAANPSTIVISGAPAPTGYWQAGCAAEGCNDDIFVRQMAEAGAANYLDCVGVHYNAGITPPESTSGAPVGSAGHYSWYLPRMMSVYRNPFPTRPLCFTELGYLTGEGLGALPGGFAWASDTSLAEQAAWLAGAVNVTRASGYVSLLIVWNVNFTVWGADPQYGYAMIRPGGGCPACDSLARVMGG